MCGLGHKHHALLAVSFFYPFHHNLNWSYLFLLGSSVMVSALLLYLWLWKHCCLYFHFQYKMLSPRKCLQASLSKLDASQSAAFPLGESQAPSVTRVRFFFHRTVEGRLCSHCSYLWRACYLASIGCGNRFLLIQEPRTNGQSHQGTCSE